MKFLLSFLSFIGVAYCWKVKENAKKYKFTLSSSAAAQWKCGQKKMPNGKQKLAKNR